MPNTGHGDFDRWKEEFSATIRDIEATMNNWAASPRNFVDGDKNTTGSIRKASSILEKLSSIAKEVSKQEQPALRQELFDIYKACKTQLKTYKILHKEKELFQSPNLTGSTSKGISVSDKESLFSSRKTTRSSIDDSSTRADESIGKETSPRDFRDQIEQNTHGRVANQSSRLRDALRSIKETEQVAQELSEELADQREMLETTQGRLSQFSSMTEHSKNLLNSMNKPWWRKW